MLSYFIKRNCLSDRCFSASGAGVLGCASVFVAMRDGGGAANGDRVLRPRRTRGAGVDPASRDWSVGIRVAATGAYCHRRSSTGEAAADARQGATSLHASAVAILTQCLLHALKTRNASLPGARDGRCGYPSKACFRARKRRRAGAREFTRWGSDIRRATAQPPGPQAHNPRPMARDRGPPARSEAATMVQGRRSRRSFGRSLLGCTSVPPMRPPIHP